jgi:hypothetical protein
MYQSLTQVLAALPPMRGEVGVRIRLRHYPAPVRLACSGVLP